ncbi:OmpA/MotB domain protein [Stanieria sp. NIES-3757]|nr:OmpA/MotB domain protein [Stanieria sp. NIES-3757]
MSNFPDYEIETQSEEQDSGVYLSISDLMSSVLMIFVLLFITVQIQLQVKVNQVRQLEIQLQAEIDKTKQLEIQLQAEIDKAKQLEIQLEKYKKAVDELPIRILDALEGKIGGKGLFTVDPETGDVSIGDRILFDEGSAELKPEGKKFLQQFIPIYSNVIFSDNLFDRQITRVVIEGHTSSKGSDQDNMELSLRRALAVSDYILSNQLKFATKERFKKKILASGRGEIDANQKIDHASDRRVVFRFQFRRENFEQFLQSKDTNKK